MVEFLDTAWNAHCISNTNDSNLGLENRVFLQRAGYLPRLALSGACRGQSSQRVSMCHRGGKSGFGKETGRVVNVEKLKQNKWLLEAPWRKCL